VPGSTRHCSPTSRVPAYRQTAAGRGADFGRLLRRVSVTPAAHALAAPIRSDWRSRTFADHAGPSMSTRRSTKVRPRFSDLAAVALDAGRRPRTQAWIATTSRARHVGANTPGSDVEELPVRVTKGLRGRAPVGEVPPASGGGSDLGANGGGGESQDCGRTMTATRAGRHPNRPVRIGERPPEARTAPTWLRHLGEGVPVTDGRRAVLSRLVDPPVAPVDPPVAPVDPPVAPVDPPVAPVAAGNQWAGRPPTLAATGTKSTCGQRATHPRGSTTDARSRRPRRHRDRRDASRERSCLVSGIAGLRWQRVCHAWHRVRRGSF
jgi:hypothetical protein